MLVGSCLGEIEEVLVDLVEREPEACAAAASKSMQHTVEQYAGFSVRSSTSSGRRIDEKVGDRIGA